MVSIASRKTPTPTAAPTTSGSNEDAIAPEPAETERPHGPTNDDDDDDDEFVTVQRGHHGKAKRTTASTQTVSGAGAKRGREPQSPQSPPGATHTRTSPRVPTPSRRYSDAADHRPTVGDFIVNGEIHAGRNHHNTSRRRVGGTPPRPESTANTAAEAAPTSSTSLDTITASTATTLSATTTTTTEAQQRL